MTLYQKKPIRVTAHKLTAENARELAAWCGGQLVEEINPLTDEKLVGINVPTRRGPERASEGDYIAQSDQGDFFPSSARKFEQAYEPVSL